jgi:DNA mismatch endonuclease Vsr
MTLDGSTDRRRTEEASDAASSWASSSTSRTRMQRQTQKNTRPERELRRELTLLGQRYRLQVRPEPDLRSRIDIVFIGARVAVDVRGCFWHGCPTHGTRPKANSTRWAEKLDRNVERDATTVAALTDRGWRVEIVWEHEDMAAAAKRVAAAVMSRRSSGGAQRAGTGRRSHV